MSFPKIAPRTALLTTLCLLASFAGLSAARAQTATFDFNSVPVRTASPLTLTQNGVTVTFTDDFGLPAPGKHVYDDGQFAVAKAAGEYSSRFSGNDLSSGDGYAGDYHPLVILFQQPAREISLDFGTSYLFGNPPPVVFSAFEGTKLVGTETITPQTLVSAPEGSLDFSWAAGFDSVTLAAAPAHYLTVDNVVVTDVGPKAVPEASPAAVFAVGLLSLAALGVQARRRAA